MFSNVVWESHFPYIISASPCNDHINLCYSCSGLAGTRNKDKAQGNCEKQWALRLLKFTYISHDLYFTASNDSTEFHLSWQLLDLNYVCHILLSKAIKGKICDKTLRYWRTKLVWTWVPWSHSPEENFSLKLVFSWLPFNCFQNLHILGSIVIWDESVIHFSFSG